jgi:hypothetical protein
MTHDEKIAWMAVWAAKNKLQLTLEGAVGFGRDCVGVEAHGQYPAYEWHDEETYDRLDKNGDVWIPQDAYHKGPYVAVLGRGEVAEAQLYDWLKWFDKNKFKLEIGEAPPKVGFAREIQLLMGQHVTVRLVKQTKKGAPRKRKSKALWVLS